MQSRDNRLGLMFRCCHPVLAREDQVALTLNILGGLTPPEIAKAFLSTEAQVSERLELARRQLENTDLSSEAPSDLVERVPAVRTVIYLMFNEGYLASMHDELHRPDRCTEALQLGRQLCEVLPREPESLGLLALMLLQDSRRDARIRDGQLITLEGQDRSLWDPIEISEGLGLVEAALRSGPVGPYQLQAAIAAVHAEAKTSAETDWRQIAALYEKLLEINPSSVIALNQAVAIAMADGHEAGLKQIDAIGSSGELDGYHLFHAARADLLRRMERFYEAADAYRQAIALATNRTERDFLTQRLNDVIKRA